MSVIEHTPLPVTLRRGITVGREALPSLELNSGTILAPVNSLRYRPSARIPKSDWRPLTAAESQFLFTEPDPGCSSVRIIPPDPEIQSLATPVFARIKQLGADCDLAAAIDSSAYAELLDAMRKSAARFGEVLGDPLVRISASDLATVTMDRGQFTGLHVDEWFQGRKSPRSARPNRLAFNLGREPRYFLFINVPVEAMMSGIPEELSGNEGTGIGLHFMESFPSYPVARIRIDPGAAYIAPTENLVHDASSAGTTHADIAGHLLGHFKTPTTSEED